MPMLAHYLGDWLLLPRPKPNHDWLSMANSPGHSVPPGPYVEVPCEIESWDDVSVVLMGI